MTRPAIRRTSAAATALVLGVGGALLAASPAAAAPFEVSTLAAGGAGSLAAAIDEANTTPGADEIVFQAGLEGTITLEGQISVTEALTITGPGPDVITITQDDDFDLFDVEILEGDFTVTGLAFLGADGPTWGRAFTIEIENDGDVTFDDVTFTGHEIPTGDGGAVLFEHVEGDVTLRDVLAEGNSADDGSGGAFMFAAEGGWIDGDVLFERVELRDNHAGGSGGGANFWSVDGVVTVVDSLIVGNDVDEDYGGGLRFRSVESGVTVTDTRFEDNDGAYEGGGVQFEYADGEILFERVVFDGNTAMLGGGLHVYGSRIDEEVGDSFTVRDSQFTANTAARGGGLSWGGAGSEESASAGFQLLVDSSSFWDNRIIEAGESFDILPVGLSIHIQTLRDGETARIINSTFDESADSDGEFAISVDADDDSVVEVLHSTVVGPGSVMLFTYDEPEGAALMSHDILESVSEWDALAAFIVGEGEGQPDVEVQRGGFVPQVDSIDPDELGFTAGPLLDGIGFTLEWSVVSTGVFEGFVVTGDGVQLNTDALLGALGDNGGETPTMLPNTGSPAINTGDPDVTGAPSTDQRDATRVVATIDIGAVETPTPATLPATGVSVPWSSVAGGLAALVLGAAMSVLLAFRRRSDLADR